MAALEWRAAIKFVEQQAGADAILGEEVVMHSEQNARREALCQLNRLARPEIANNCLLLAEIIAAIDGEQREIKLDSVLKTAVVTPPKEKPTPGADDGDTDALDEETQAKLDVHLREALRVVSDALRLDKDPQYWADGRAPITALHKGE